MARINLLPWREELRRQRHREFVVTAAGSAIFMVLVVLYVHLHINGLIERQEQRNHFLQENIQRVEAKIREIRDLEKKKEQLLARMQVIERLQGNRPAIVHLFDEMVTAVPEGLYLTALTQSGDTLTLNGRAQSNARVSSFMRNLDTSAWFTDPQLDVIQTEGGPAAMRTFTLKVKQTAGDRPQGRNTTASVAEE